MAIFSTFCKFTAQNKCAYQIQHTKIFKIANFQPILNFVSCCVIIRFMAKVIHQKFRDSHKTPLGVSSKNTSSYITLDKNMSPPQIPFKLHSFFFIRTMVLNEKTLKFPKKLRTQHSQKKSMVLISG